MLRPRPRWGSSQRYPDTIAGFKGPTSKLRGEQGREGQGRGRGQGRQGVGEGKVMGGEEEREEKRGSEGERGRDIC